MMKRIVCLVSMGLLGLGLVVTGCHKPDSNPRGAGARATIPADTPLMRWRQVRLIDALGAILPTAPQTRITTPVAQIEPYVAHRAGVYPIEPYKSPTKVASTGLGSLAKGDVNYAKKCLEWIVSESQPAAKDGAALLVMNQFDYALKFPYSLRAPWPSSITQGLALELAVQIYALNKEGAYGRIARELYRGYTIAMEQGGFTRWVDGLPVFEEYPVSNTLIAVLNGHAVAALAVEGYAQVFDDAAAHELFVKSVAWLEKNVDKYEATEEGCALSRYSLAERRNETLFRFYAVKGQPFVHSISLRAVSQGASSEIAHIAVGSPGDTNVLNPGYIWYNPNYQCWGDSGAQNGAKGRPIVGYPGAKFNHSPFTFAVCRASEPLELAIDLSAGKGDSFAVHLYIANLKSYGLLYRFETEKEGRQLLTIPFTDELAKCLPETLLTPETVDRKYLDDNQELLQALGETASSPRLLYFARRWDRDWVTELNNVANGAAINNDRRAAAFPWKPDSPMLDAGATSLSVAFPDCPAVIRTREGLLMYYLDGRGGPTPDCFVAKSPLDGSAWRAIGKLRFSLPAPANLLWCSAVFANGIDDKDGVALICGCRERGGRAMRLAYARSRDGVAFETPLWADADILAQPAIFFDADAGLWHVCGTSQVSSGVIQLRSYVTDQFPALTQTGAISAEIIGAGRGGDACVLPGPQGTRIILWDTPSAWKAYYYDPRKKMAAFAGAICHPATAVMEPVTHLGRLDDGAFFAVRLPRAGAAGQPVIWRFRMDKALLERRLLPVSDAFRVGSTRDYTAQRDGR